MAKKKRTEPFPIKTWAEADEAIKTIAITTAKINSIVADYNEKEQERRAKVSAEVEPLKDYIASLEIGLELFTSENRAAMGKMKSRELTHGIVAFRFDPPSIKTVKGITEKAALGLVKASKWAWRFIRSKEEIDRDDILAAIASKDLTELELTGLGLRRVQDEQFHYSVKNAVPES